MRPSLRASLLALLLSTTTAQAEETFLAATPPLPAAMATEDVMRLGLADAVRLAVKQNFDVVLEQQQVRVTEHGVAAADGVFEPVVTAGYRHSDTDSPPVTVQEGESGQILTYTDDAWQVQIEKLWSFGTRTSLGFQSGRTQSSAGTAVAPVNNRSQLQLSITQPILRGFATDRSLQTIDVIRARISSDREREQLTVTMAAVVERVEAAYWEVLRALYRYDVSLRSQQAAERQLALTRKQIEAGTLPPSDLIGAESTLAERELTVLQAEQGIRAASDQLRGELNLPRAEWARPILPTDLPTFAPAATTAEAALETALQRRPELAQMNLDLEAAQLAIRKANNDKLPQLDVGVTGAIVGQDQDLAGSLDQLAGIDARGWSVFFNFTWTPLNRTTRALAHVAEVQADQARLRRDRIVQQVWLEVRDAVRNQQSAEQQIAAAARFRNLAEQSLAVEERKFLAGQSDNLFVVQRQVGVQTAQLAELDALVAYKRASVTLLRTTGVLLEQRQLQVAKRTR